MNYLHIDLVNVIGDFLGDCRYKLVFHQTPMTRILSRQIAVVPRKNLPLIITDTFPKTKQNIIYRYTNFAAHIYYLPKLKAFYRVPMGRKPKGGRTFPASDFSHYYMRASYPY
jgi:hypothetical protein